MAVEPEAPDVMVLYALRCAETIARKQAYHELYFHQMSTIDYTEHHMAYPRTQAEGGTLTKTAK
jgi:hypothetical protein